MKNEQMLSNWEEAYDAQNEKSPTFSETVNVSARSIEDIEAYLTANPELDQKEKAFLETSIKTKQQSQQSKVEDEAAAEEIREELIERTAPVKEEQTSNEGEVPSVDIEAIKKGIQMLGIDSETVIRLDAPGSDMWKKNYLFTDKKASKRSLFEFLNFGTTQRKANLYQMLGSAATERGIDLGEGKTVSEIISLLEQKAA